MNREELNKMQTKILKKNKICNYTLGILLLLILFITLIIVINKRITFVFIIFIIFIEIIFGIAMMIIIKNIINGKDIKKFNKEYKNIYVLNFLKQNFENIIYKPEEGISKKDIKKYNTLNLGDKFTSNDYICGTYKNVKFEQSDIHIQEKYEEEDKDGNKIITWETTFEGRYMIFDFNKNFKSNVQVISNDFIKRSLPHIKNNKKVKLEDIEFNKMFKIYSEIEHDAFYILTPHFMEKIKKLYKELDAPIKLTFMENKLHVAVNNGEDSFEYNVLNPINEEEIEQDIIKDIKLITDFVNELNLDNDLFKKEA
ncbi:MAG: DUF3137 domain-containing protein [Tenericutes bacterium]|nr:DUF3137 domain-containing protein [Mycoplasmatota bacterium]